MNYFLKKVKSNWQAGLTVALVSLPMSVALAVASESTPTVGIITAFWAGLVAAIFGGSHYNIVGPAGALTGILAAFAMLNGADSLAMLAIISGIVIFIAYILKLYKYLSFIPGSVIHGFTLGVAFILALGQINFAFGLKGLEKHPEFIENILESLQNISSLDLYTTTSFFIFTVLMFICLKYIKRVPPAILVTPITILLGYLSVNNLLPFHLETLGERFPSIDPSLFKVPSFILNREIIIASFTITAVAIIETMLCGKMADLMTNTRYNRSKEMLGLSLANIASGLAGGLPATAVLARTALNAKSGADHKTAQGINAVFVAIISMFFLGFFKFIPMSAVAAILVFTSVRMVEMHHLIRTYSHDKFQFVIAVVVACVTIVVDPIVGILLGTAVALIVFVDRISKGHFEVVGNNKEKGMIGSHIGHTLEGMYEDIHTLVYSIKGQLVYVNAQSHINRFENDIKNCENVVIRMKELYFMDLDGVDAFEEMVTLVEKKGMKVFVTGVNSIIYSVLSDSEVYKKLLKENKVFASASDVLNSLGYDIKPKNK